MYYFSQRYNDLRFPIDSENSSGLRNAQLGAVHAIAAFSTLRKKSAGIVVMPTGSGKTAVLMMTPYMLLSRKVLIVTPSKMVRGQIFDDFSSLSTLKKTCVFQEAERPPAIFELRNCRCISTVCIISFRERNKRRVRSGSYRRSSSCSCPDMATDTNQYESRKAFSLYRNTV